MIGVSYREALLALGMVAGYAALMWTNPARHALRDGVRALRRYRQIWTIPAALGLCYAAFQAAVTLFFYKVLPMEQQPAFGWRLEWVTPEWTSRLRETHTMADWLRALFAGQGAGIMRRAFLDGVEAVAGLFNNVVTTFPLSALAAVLLLVNWENHHATLRAALNKRYKRMAWAVHSGIVLCALSAVVAPVLFGPSLLYLNRMAPALEIIRWAALVDWLSSLFAYLFGLGVQVYLILLAYTWLRGLNWTPVHLMDLAIRRFSYVVRWGLVVIGASALLIDLPRIFALMFCFRDPDLFSGILNYIDVFARPALAIFLIFFSTMQVTLTFHSETLREALGHHWHILGRFWVQVCWFLVVAGVHLFGLAFFNRWLLTGLGGETTTTAAGMVWGFVRPVISALLAAWLLAAWVSLYKRCETGRVLKQDMFPF